MKNPTAPPICLFIATKQRVAAWYYQAASYKIRRLPVQGQDMLVCGDEHSLCAALTDIRARLEAETPAVVWHLVLDAQARKFITRALSDFADRDDTCWQCLDAGWLEARLGLEDMLQDPGQVQTLLLPWLTSADDAVERARMREALAAEHQSESARLAAERARLEADNQRLREQNAALQQVDMERLVRFLPALYPAVFTQIGAHDIALLCGRVEPPTLPNPYPEPSPEVLRVLQRDFYALPKHLQREIVGLVARLSLRERLKPRPEMRDLIEQLESTDG
jgi:hypothetical protein